MDIEALLMQSLQLLGLGMGSVFIILILMIVIITVVAKIVPEEVIAVPVTTPPGVDPAHIAAISAAIHLHRKKR
jgi:Na+-transporting methylmalonyl-CoA/oxaloacetate decarboxylase gamma subunit